MTAIIAAAGYFLYSVDGLILFCIIFLGIFSDLDHISSWNYLKGYFDGTLEVDKNWINWMHTWQFLLVVAFISFLIGNYLPFLSISVHIFMDGFNRANLKYPNSPIPTAMVKWLLRHGWWTYWYSETGEPDHLDYSEYQRKKNKIKNPQFAES